MFCIWLFAPSTTWLVHQRCHGGRIPPEGCSIRHHSRIPPTQPRWEQNKIIEKLLKKVIGSRSRSSVLTPPAVGSFNFKELPRTSLMNEMFIIQFHSPPFARQFAVVFFISEKSVLDEILCSENMEMFLFHPVFILTLIGAPHTLQSPQLLLIIVFTLINIFTFLRFAS